MLRHLIANISETAKYSRPRNSGSKRAYFDKKWGSDAAFDKNMDRSQYETLAFADYGGQGQINDQILIQYKTKFSEDPSAFLDKLAKETQDFIVNREHLAERVKRDDALRNTHMVFLMEQLFETLTFYSFELNNAVGFGPLHIATTSPRFVTEAVRFNRLRDAEEVVTYYRARLSTSTLSLVMRGDKNGIQIFIMPVARAIGLSKQESFYRPLVTLQAKVSDDQIFWCQEDGSSVSVCALEALCMNLFQEFVAKNRISLLEQTNSRNSGADPVEVD
ncbi:MAG: hypothetical protein K2W82_01715 [Candidatus Obscuribacterales bacterium]|nr:hypothetical protein [Candidatus Obscuribacterales bacterium]